MQALPSRGGRKGATARPATVTGSGKSECEAAAAAAAASWQTLCHARSCHSLVILPVSQRSRWGFNRKNVHRTSTHRTPSLHTIRSDIKSGGSERFLPSLLLPGEENLSAGGREGSVSSTLAYYKSAPDQSFPRFRNRKRDVKNDFHDLFPRLGSLHSYEYSNGFNERVPSSISS